MVGLSVVEIASKHNGFVTTSQVTNSGIPRRKLAEAVEEGALIRIDRGLYALPEVWEDPYLIAQHRFSRGIFSDDTALFLHGMTDRAPFVLTMTFPRSYNASAARDAGIVCRACSDEVYDLGVVTMRTEYGNSVRLYDLERSLCDVVRGQKTIDSQVVAPAMKAYARSKRRDAAKLIWYAGKLGVEKKVRGYLEVLL